MKKFFRSIISNQLFIPIAALLLLIIFNLIADPSFFAIKYQENQFGDMVLSGNPISVLNFGSELAILAIGMTLVTAASGGQDISVGAAIAIAGSTIMRILWIKDDPSQLANPIWLAFIVAVVVAMLFGAFNGALVAYFKIQPMVATLILFTAGRSIAAWINGNELPNITEVSLSYRGGFIPGIPVPTPILITILCLIVVALVMKFTNLKLYVQTVGINENSSRLNGLNPKVIKLVTYIILGVCVAVAALIKVGRTGTINYSTIAKDIEMDAILAVALGGNALSGGKFNIGASVLGAYVIQFLTTTLYKFKVPSDALSAYKAVVVILLVIFSSQTFRDFFAKLGKKRTAAKAKGGAQA